MALIRPDMKTMKSSEMKLGVEGDWLRMLLMGDAKVGKTFTTLKTALQPIFIINCDQKSALRGAIRHKLPGWEATEPVHSVDDMNKALKMARYLIAEEGVKTVIWDTLTVYAKHLLKEKKSKAVNNYGAVDTRKAWGEFGDTLLDYVDRFVSLPAHVIVNAHFVDEHEDLVDDDGNPDNVAKRKATRGKVPLIQGRAKKLITAEFDDIVVMEKRTGGRVFVTSDEGVYGPGGRSVDVSEMPASVKGFMREAGMLPPLKKKSSSKEGV
jgi:hypothetical protein